MSKRTIWAGVRDGNYIEWTEVKPFVKKRDFFIIHADLVAVADELANAGRDSDLYYIGELMEESYILLNHGNGGQTAEDIRAAYYYMCECDNKGNEIYLPYIQNRVLDFVLCSVKFNNMMWEG